MRRRAAGTMFLCFLINRGTAASLCSSFQHVLTDPVSRTLMRDPYITVDGNTYDITTIRAWLERGHISSPLTGKALGSLDLVANQAISDLREVSKWPACEWNPHYDDHIRFFVMYQIFKEHCPAEMSLLLEQIGTEKALKEILDQQESKLRTKLSETLPDNIFGSRHPSSSSSSSSSSGAAAMPSKASAKNFNQDTDADAPLNSMPYTTASKMINVKWIEEHECTSCDTKNSLIPRDSTAEEFVVMDCSEAALLGSETKLDSQRYPPEVGEISVPLREVDSEFGVSSAFGWRRQRAGLKITHVEPNGLAARAGVRVGWIIVAVNGHDTRNDEREYRRLLAAGMKEGLDPATALAASTPQNLVGAAQHLSSNSKVCTSRIYFHFSKKWAEDGVWKTPASEVSSHRADEVAQRAYMDAQNDHESARVGLLNHDDDGAAERVRDGGRVMSKHPLEGIIVHADGSVTHRDGSQTKSLNSKYSSGLDRHLSGEKMNSADDSVETLTKRIADLREQQKDVRMRIADIREQQKDLSAVIHKDETSPNQVNKTHGINQIDDTITKDHTDRDTVGTEEKAVTTPNTEPFPLKLQNLPLLPADVAKGQWFIEIEGDGRRSLMDAIMQSAPGGPVTPMFTYRSEAQRTKELVEDRLFWRRMNETYSGAHEQAALLRCLYHRINPEKLSSGQVDQWLLKFLGKEQKLIDKVVNKYGLFDSPTKNQCVQSGDYDNDSANLEVDVVRWSNGDVYNGTWKIMPVTPRTVQGGLGDHPPKASYSAANPIDEARPLMQRKMHGAGVFRYSSGDYYQGDFRNGMRYGYGEYYWPNGMRYYGEWREDKRDGIGVFYDQNGKRSEDTYQNDAKKCSIPLEEFTGK